MPSGVGLAFAALSLLLAWLLWASRGPGGSGPWALRLRSAIPPLLLLVCLPSGCNNERFDTLRLYARGMAVTETGMQGARRQAVGLAGCEAYFGAADLPVFVVGRARGCVDLVVQDPSGPPIEGAAVRLDSTGDDASLRLQSLAGNGAALVTAEDGTDGRSYAGAVPLGEGDALCLNRCGAADAAWWTLSGNKLTHGDAERTLRVRSVRGGEAVVRLSALLCASPETDGDCPAPALADPAHAGETARPAVSFLSSRGGTWQALLLDPGAAIRRAGGQTVRAAGAVTEKLAAGETRHVALLALRGNVLRELRSFTLGHQLSGAQAERSYTLALDTPEMIPIGNCTAPLTRLAVAPEETTSESFAIPAFGNRAGSVLASAAASLPIDQFDFCRSTRFAFSSPLDPADGGPATAIERRQIRFEVDRMGLPWPLVLLAALTALVIHAASARLWSVNRLDGVLLSLVQYLLVLRTIIGIEGVFNDIGVEWRAIYTDVGTAMVVIPMILLAARRRRESQVTTLLSLAGFAAAALAALWLWLGRPDAIGLFLWALAFAALAVRGVTSLIHPPHDFVGRGTVRAANGGVGAAEPRNLSDEDEDAHGAPLHNPADGPPPLQRQGRNLVARLSALVLDRPPNFWPILLAVIVLARLGLGLLGFRERVFGIALSAIYVPLLLLVVAAILAQAEQQPDRRKWTGLWFLVALAAGAGLVALIIRDIGFALVHVPPIAGVALWRLRLWRRSAERPDRLATLAFAAPAAALFVGYFGLWAMVALSPPPPDDAPLEQRIAYSVADHSTDQNWLRLRAVFAPGQIERIGNRNAAIQLDQSQLLGDLTGTLFGRGWLAPVDLGTFRHQATHLSDYLSASHLMAPFGRMGALALLFVLAAAAGAAVCGRVPVPTAWPRMAGALAMWTLFGAATYMICANLLLVPFTGRNIYLLAASSGGDLIEALFLLLIARIGLTHNPAAEGAR